MANLVKIVGTSVEGEQVQVRCTEIGLTGERRGDFNVHVPAFNSDNTPRTNDEIKADVSAALKARHVYATGRAQPEVKLPEFFEMDGGPVEAK